LLIDLAAWLQGFLFVVAALLLKMSCAND